MAQSLKACPACGKQAGELIDEKASRFPFRVTCRACGWTTDAVKLEAVAAKLWNEAKRESKARARSKTPPKRSADVSQISDYYPIASRGTKKFSPRSLAVEVCPLVVGYGLADL
jgi:hypothetical protein